MPTVPETLTQPQKLSSTPETQPNEIPVLIQDHEAGLNIIKKLEPEAKLPEADMDAYDNYIKIVMQAHHEQIAIGDPEQTAEEKAAEQEPREPLLRMIGRGLVDFFPRIREIAGATAEDARRSIERKRWYETSSKKGLDVADKRAAELGQTEKVKPIDIKPVVAPQPVAVEAPTLPANVTPFPVKEAVQTQSVPQKPQQIAA